MKHPGLGAKFLIGGLALLVIPIMIIGFVSVVESTRGISTMAQNDLSIMAEGLANTLEVGMQDQLIMVRNMAGLRTIQAAAQERLQRGVKLATYSEAEEEFTRIKDNIGENCSSINVCGRDGIIFASTNTANLGGDLSTRDYMISALKGQASVGSIVISKFTGRIISTAGSPVYAPDGKTIIGAVAIGMEIKYLTDLIDKAKVGKTGYATITEGSGLVIAHPVKENILSENIAEIPGMEPYAQMVKRGGHGIVEYTRNGVAKLAGMAPVPLTGWSVAVTIEEDDLYSSATMIRNQIVLLGLVALLAAATILFFFSRSIVNPLNKVVGAANAIAQGNLCIDVEYTSRHDEIGSLAKAFATMLTWLRGMAQVAERISGGDLAVQVSPLSEQDQLGKAFSAMVDRLQGHLRSISDGVNVLTSAGSEILASTTQIVAGTTETASAINQTTATVEQVRQAAQLSAEKAQNVSDNARHVNDTSESGQKAVNDTMDAMLHIRDQMETIAHTIVRLSEQSQSIGGIIATVTDLADQSNLLAVNTAIEAARAGDQGKGFTVIAQEIRNLSEQSKQATIQIRSILGDVQKATSAAVTAAEEGTKAVDAGVDQSSKAGEAIGILTESSAEATQTAIQIVASSRQQVIGMDQIGIAMTNISQAGTQTVTSMHQAEQVAQNLNELGLKLKSLVDQYKT